MVNTFAAYRRNVDWCKTFITIVIFAVFDVPLRH